MPRQASQDSILVSAARVVGTTLGHVKRLTTEGAQASARKRRSGSHLQDSPAKTRSASSSATQRRPARSTEQPRTRTARPRATTQAVPALEEHDMAAAQAGASRSPRQTVSSRRGKSRSKRSKSRRASRRS